MKKTLLLLLLTFTGLTSCKKDALDVNFSTDLSATSDEIVVNETQRNVMTGQDYSTTFVLDMDNSDTHDYLDQLKSLNLSNVNISFEGLENLAGNNTVVDLTITIDNDIIITIPDFNYDMVAQGEPFAITNMQKIEQIADRLLANKKINIIVSGSIPSGDTFHFYITFSAKADIKASAL